MIFFPLDLPAWRFTSVAPRPVIGHALNGNAVIDLGHGQREGQNRSASHYQPKSPKQKDRDRNKGEMNNLSGKRQTVTKREIEGKRQIRGGVEFLQKKIRDKKSRQMGTDRWREWEFKIKSHENTE